MKKSITKKTLSTLIIALFLLQAFIPSSALAGNTGLNYDNPNKFGSDSPYKVSLKGIINSRLLTSLVGCTGIVDKVSKVTTEFIQKKLTNKSEKTQQKQKQNSEKQNSVPGVDDALGDLLLETGQKEQASADKKAFTENCLNGIATTLVKNQLTAMTKYTMNWITTGFNGDPMYVRDVDSYMDSLTTAILKKENDLFKDPANADAYPYGRDYAIGQINAYKAGKDTLGSMKQDLTNYLTPGATPDSFARDFTQGGWNGWLAFTQHSENNPLGFTVDATAQLNKKKNTAVSNAQAELARNGGVFDQKKCIQQSKTPPFDCVRYETVTPGSVIKTKIDTYINSPERQIELSKTLNDGLNSLFSILINTFENQGLSSLGSKDNTFTNPVSGGFGSNNIVDAIGNSIASGTAIGSQVSANTNGAPFDLTRDLGNKYVLPINGGAWDANSNTPELTPGTGTKNQYYTVSVAGDTKLFAGTHHWTTGQKAFFDGTVWKVGVPNHLIETRGIYQIQKDYLNSIKKATTILPKVIPKLAELDYCIPGPNYNWESNSDAAKNAYFDYLSGVSVQYVRDVYDKCPFIGCDGIQTIGGLLNGGLDHSYNVISLPDPTDYKKVFDDARNLWDKIVNEEFYWIAKNTVHLTYTFSSDHWAVDPVFVEIQIKKWNDLATKNYNEYVTKSKEIFGINSPMLTEFTPEGNPNPKFLPMAQAGLDLTKNIVTDAEDISKAIISANDNYAQASGNIYRLGFIKDKVNAIVIAAQNRRKTRRIADGLTPMPQICLDNEKVTWIEIQANGNDIIKQ